MCGRACAAGQVCSEGACTTTCGPGLATCGAGDTAFCTNTQIDPTNCGGCGNVCALPSAATNGCVAGPAPSCAARPPRATATARHGQRLRDEPPLRRGGCGACGRACALPNASAACTGGACVIGACNPGFADCDGMPANGCEVDTRTDNANCGTCRTVCTAGQVCSGSVCGTTCAPGLATCPSVGGAPPFCANTNVDPANWWMCGRVCALPSVASNGCAAGACTVVTCNAGTGNCDGVAANGCETNLQTSGANCGACGRACALPNASASCAGRVRGHGLQRGLRTATGSTPTAARSTRAPTTPTAAAAGACAARARCARTARAARPAGRGSRPARRRAARPRTARTPASTRRTAARAATRAGSRRWR
ncbi:MAG: hypothetical protein R3A52_06435 [Polyangiales bacterium]